MIKDVALRITRLATRLVIWPAALASVLAMFAASWWVADLAVHFRLQYALIGLIGVPLALALGERHMVFAAMIALALNLLPATRYFEADASPIANAMAQETQTFQPVRLASLNVFFGSNQHDAVAEWIEQSNADVVALLEADADWEAAMIARLPAWSHHWLSIVDGRSGKLLLSRLPFEARTTIASHSIRAPSPVVTVSVNGARFQVAAVHTVWPMGSAGQSSRNRELRELAGAARAAELPFVAMGDYNISPFSPHFDTLLDDSGLHRVAAGRGWQPTWPSFLPVAGIQIDHVLVSPTIKPTGLHTQKGPGSDHRALVADLLIPR